MPIKTKKKAKLGPVKHTNRGFEVIEFKDHNDTPCSLQQSSLAIYQVPGSSALWIGVDDAHPRVMASRASGLGVKTDETCGWVPYPIPQDVLLSTRMHITREQAKAIVTHLQAWLKTGSLKVE